MRKENIAKEKEQKETARAIEQIEAVRVSHLFYINDADAAFFILILDVTDIIMNNSFIHSVLPSLFTPQSLLKLLK